MNLLVGLFFALISIVMIVLAYALAFLDVAILAWGGYELIKLSQAEKVVIHPNSNEDELGDAVRRSQYKYLGWTAIIFSVVWFIVKIVT